MGEFLRISPAQRKGKRERTQTSRHWTWPYICLSFSFQLSLRLGFDGWDFFLLHVLHLYRETVVDFLFNSVEWADSECDLVLYFCRASLTLVVVVVVVAILFFTTLFPSSCVCVCFNHDLRRACVCNRLTDSSKTQERESSRRWRRILFLHHLTTFLLAPTSPRWILENKIKRMLVLI